VPSRRTDALCAQQVQWCSVVQDGYGDPTQVRSNLAVRSCRDAAANRASATAQKSRHSGYVATADLTQAMQTALVAPHGGAGRRRHVHAQAAYRAP